MPPPIGSAEPRTGHASRRPALAGSGAVGVKLYKQVVEALPLDPVACSEERFCKLVLVDLAVRVAVCAG